MMARIRITVVVGLAVAIVGCSTPLTTREKGALAGGAIGAGAGAAIGSQTGHAGTGALIGAGLGAVSGAVIGDAIQGTEQKQAAAAAPPPPVPQAAPTPLPPQPVVVAPPPVIVQQTPPQLVVIPGTPVYYAPAVNINYFFHAGRYYTFHNGAWFYAAAHNGLWTFIAVEHVPQPILAVPVTYYKVPPGHWKKGGPPPWAGQGRGHKQKKWKDQDDD